MTTPLLMEPEDAGIDEQSMPTLTPTLSMAPEDQAPAPTGVMEVRLEPAAAAPLAELLPANFPLPALIHFVPNRAIRTALDEASAYALSIDVKGPEGLQRADLALTALNDAIKAADAHFEEPAAIANRLHKQITTVRGEWTADGKSAKNVVGQRVYAENDRLDREARRVVREAQEEANRLAREDAEREAERAAKSKAPAAVVEQLKEQAKTATAPPVPVPAIAPPAMKGTTVTTTWKARLVGTPADDEPNPKVADLSIAQQAQLKALLKAILDDKAPITAIEFNWSVLNGRAKADKSTLAIPGVEAFTEGGVRAKGTRSR